MDEKIRKTYELWLNSDYLDEADREELKSIKDNEKEIEEKFYTNISFGTAGMRWIRGIGTNRINKYMIRNSSCVNFDIVM